MWSGAMVSAGAESPANSSVPGADPPDGRHQSASWMRISSSALAWRIISTRDAIISESVCPLDLIAREAAIQRTIWMIAVIVFRGI